MKHLSSLKQLFVFGLGVLTLGFMSAQFVIPSGIDNALQIIQRILITTNGTSTGDVVLDMNTGVNNIYLNPNYLPMSNPYSGDLVLTLNSLGYISFTNLTDFIENNSFNTNGTWSFGGDTFFNDSVTFNTGPVNFNNITTNFSGGVVNNTNTTINNNSGTVINSSGTTFNNTNTTVTNNNVTTTNNGGTTYNNQTTTYNSGDVNNYYNSTNNYNSGTVNNYNDGSVTNYHSGSVITYYSGTTIVFQSGTTITGAAIVGPQGPQGPIGLTGPVGPQGANGQDGVNGSDGLNTLFLSTIEDPGANCTNGGTLIRYGLDINQNDILDGIEQTNFFYICDGEVISGGGNSPWRVGGGVYSVELIGNETNESLGDYSVVGGTNNLADDNSHFGFIGGGSGNLLDTSSISPLMLSQALTQIGDEYFMGQYNNIIGGSKNSIVGFGSMIGGGVVNEIVGMVANIVGGWMNFISASYSSIVGGFNNSIHNGEGNFIGGGQNNLMTGSTFSLIVGGQHNAITGDNITLSSILGGGNNTIFAGPSTIAGGIWNKIYAHSSNIAGGFGNQIYAIGGVVGGGESNMIELGQTNSFIGGGHFNRIFPFVAGATNTPNPGHHFIGGGIYNEIDNKTLSVIVGGENNFIGHPGGSIIAGWSAIVGGHVNSIYDTHSFIGGGAGNVVHTGANAATIVGGSSNNIFGQYASIGGGEQNNAYGDHSFVAGGQQNSSSGNHSFAGGIRASALHNNSFVWNGDPSQPIRLPSGSSSIFFPTTEDGQFLINAPGNVGINTNVPEKALHVEGAIVSSTTSITGPFTGTVDVQSVNAIFLDTTGGEINLYGLENGTIGQIVTIVRINDDTSPNRVRIRNEDGNASSQYRFSNPGGSLIQYLTNIGRGFIYNGDRWNAIGN